MEVPTPIPLETLLAHREWVRRVALALVRDENLADDLEQDLWVKAMERPPVVRGSIRGWLAATLRNTVIDGFRGESSRRRREQVAARPERLRSTVDVVAEADGLKRVVNAVMDLPEPYRATVLLRYYEVLEPREIAARQGVPVETVRTRLRRAIAMLRERFDNESHGDRKAWCLALLPLMGKPEAALPTATGAGAAIAGGLLISGKVVAVGAAVAILGFAGWLFLRPQAQPTSRALTVADKVEPRLAPFSLPTPMLDSEVSTDAVPLPVDLAKCDRDLDLFGTVVDEVGVPVAGASLELILDPRRGSSFLTTVGDMAPRVDASSRSASDGTFCFRLARGTVRDLRVVARGLAEALLPNCLAGERLRVVLHPGGTFVVVARNEKREPVEGAFVRLGRWVDGAEPVFVRTGLTDGEGRCVFPSLVPGRVSFMVTHPRYGIPDGGFAAVPLEGVRTLEVILPEGQTVYGTVRDGTTHAPVAGARVYASWEGNKALLTDEEGRFAYPGWRPIGISWLRVDADGYSTGKAMVSPGVAAEVLLSVEDVVEGRVVDGQGHPIPLALVASVGKTVKGAGGEKEFDVTRSAMTGPDGTFRIRGLRHDLSHFLLVRAEGHGALLREFGPAPWNAGTIFLGDVALSGAASLEGTLTDASGSPVPRVPVILEGPVDVVPEGMESLVTEDRRTDDLGRYRFYGLGPGRYRVTLHPDTRAPKPPSVDATLGEGDELKGVDLHLETGGSLAALVVDPTGAPVPGADVFATAPDQTWMLSRWSDAEGRVVFSGLPAGKVCLMAGGFFVCGEPYTSSARTEPLDADGSTVTLSLRPIGEVKGRVIGANGSPLENVEVRATSSDGSWAWFCVTDAQGEFKFNPPGGGSLRLEVNGTVWKDRNDPKTRGPSDLRAPGMTVSVPSEGILLRVGVPDLKTLTVRLLDLEGRPVAGVRVLDWTVSPAISVVTGPDGRARFEGLLPDEAQFGFFPGGLPEGCVLPAGFKVVPDGQELPVTLRRGVPFAGTVFRADGNPAVKAMVSVDAADGTASLGTTDADGGFKIYVLPGVRLKEVSAMVRTGEKSGEVARLKDVDPESGPVTIRLEPAEK